MNSKSQNSPKQTQKVITVSKKENRTLGFSVNFYLMLINYHVFFALVSFSNSKGCALEVDTMLNTVGLLGRVL